MQRVILAIGLREGLVRKYQLRMEGEFVCLWVESQLHRYGEACCSVSPSVSFWELHFGVEGGGWRWGGSSQELISAFKQISSR